MCRLRTDSSPARAPHARPIALDALDVVIEPGRDQAFYARAASALCAYDAKVAVWLDRWAAARPDHVFLAERPRGAVEAPWLTLTYAQARSGVRRLAQALLARGLGPERPLVILSSNSIAHALLGLAALYIGVLYVPLSPAAAGDPGRLSRLFSLLTPGLVFIEDETALARVQAALAPGTPCLVCAAARTSDAELFTDFLATSDNAAVDSAAARVGPETIAKLLFTSGSTGMPKAVITTHRMLCANQAMIAQVLSFLAKEPPILVDWLPWSHSFGGNQNFNLVLAHGGALYIDAGRPTGRGLATTIANLRDVSPTLHFNVPSGISALLPALKGDTVLAENFLRRLRLMFSAGAPMPRATYDAWNDIARTGDGAPIMTMSGYGATESGPATTFWTPARHAGGGIGLPLPGCELKLVPHGEKLDVRVRGPHVTPGYWRDAAATRRAFDEEGFFRLGDAVRLAEAGVPRKGFCFDGRLSEDFKLATGTWVNGGALREALCTALAPLAQDAVIVGNGEAFVAALVFPDFSACEALIGAAAPPQDLIAHPRVRARFQALLDSFAATAGGSSRRVERIFLLATGPEPAEMTEKGGLKHTEVAARRASAVVSLFSATPSAEVIVARPCRTSDSMVPVVF